MLKLILVFLYVLSIADVTYAMENIPLVTKKYSYGYMSNYGRRSIKESKPSFHVLSGEERYYFSSPGYLLTDKENADLQSKANLYINLKGGTFLPNKIKLTIQFSNESDRPVYIPNIFLTYFKKNAADTAYSSSCKQEFIITTDNTRLDYVGGHCDGWSSDPDSDEWVKILPKHSYVIDYYLDDGSYVFPVGMRSYNIGTLEYPFVTDLWFLSARINRAMFNILNFKVACTKDNSKNYLTDQDVCAKYYFKQDQDNIDNFLFNLDMIGGDEDEYKIIVRSNRINMSFNGVTH